MIILIFGYCFVLFGLVLDVLNLIWGIGSAKGLHNKSGVIIVPGILYIVGILLLMKYYELSLLHTILLIIGSVLFHLTCDQFIPAILDKKYNKIL